MEGKTYGTKKIMYRVVENGYDENRFIILHVHHSNDTFRRVIKNNLKNTKYLLRRYETYYENHETAKKWFAEVMNDYREYFKKNKVEFTFENKDILMRDIKEKTEMKTKQLEKPSVELVKKYNVLFDQNEIYGTADEALSKLYRIYPKNNQLDEVFLKVVTLNGFYNTNIYYPFEVTLHIMTIQPDDEMESGSVQIVEDLAKVKVGEKTIRYYSFMTKFCSWHNSKDYPIYDQFVDKILWGYKKQDDFSEFKRYELKKYQRLRETINDFIKFYQLEDFNYKQIDKFLWYYGRTVFS
jgi:hypothetical protein